MRARFDRAGLLYIVLIVGHYDKVMPEQSANVIRTSR